MAVIMRWLAERDEVEDFDCGQRSSSEEMRTPLPKRVLTYSVPTSTSKLPGSRLRKDMNFSLAQVVMAHSTSSVPAHGACLHKSAHSEPVAESRAPRSFHTFLRRAGGEDGARMPRNAVAESTFDQLSATGPRADTR